jgi:putative ABC transport system ATP-binding protein
MIELSQLEFTWPGDAQPTLSIERWSVMPGEHVFLQGPSGLGKSTLLSVLAGVQANYRGSVKLLGQEWSSLSGPQRDQFRAEHIGLIFQQFNLIPYLNALENVCLPLQFSKGKHSQKSPANVARNPSSNTDRNDDVKEAARSLLVSLGVHAELHTKPARLLSVGQQQRVAAVRAMIGKPELILADEPTSALDHENQMQFIEQLMKLARKQNTAIVFVSHDERLAAHFSRTVQLSGLNKVQAFTGLRSA